MDKFLEAIKDDLMPVVIVNVVLLTYAALILQSIEVPKHLETLSAVVVAFYFGGKAVSQGTMNGERKFQTLSDIAKQERSPNGRATDR